jgi:hypothetical protein
VVLVRGRLSVEALSPVSTYVESAGAFGRLEASLRRSKAGGAVSIAIYGTLLCTSYLYNNAFLRVTQRGILTFFCGHISTRSSILWTEIAAT